MSKPVVLPVILAGGSGERLWPLSRSAYPKQFLNLLGAKISLLQATLQRLPKESDNFLPPLLVCHEDHRFLLAEQLRSIEINPSAIILEPRANNTAPAIALAAHWATKNHPDAIMLILPADHYIPDADSFVQAVNSALPMAQQDKIVTFGIPVTKPETGYGYIEKGDSISAECFSIKRFIEKPNFETAQQYVNDRFFWNGGIFLTAVDRYLHELQEFQPTIVATTLDAMNNSTEDLDFIRPNVNSYTPCPSISIDYAIMENTNCAAVVPLNCQWSDVGSWEAVWEQSQKDPCNNATMGDVVTQNSHNCLVEARHRLVATVDVDDLTIVETNDAVLVSKRDNSAALKTLIADLKEQGHLAATENRHVVRPWGFYDSLIQGERFQVKLLVLQAGRSISLQMHHHRSEHWIVVKGSAKVTRGDQQFILTENESTFIPIGTKHQLSNNGKIPLEVIEVQSGSYLGEDDIIRFEEEYAYA